MNMDISPNEKILQSLGGENFLYCPNPGNAGDSAIACATYLAFERFGCRYSVISPECSGEETAGRVVVYGGGGNLVRYYPNAAQFIAKHHRSAKRLVLLPHTIDGHEDLLSSLGPNVELYCRENQSLEYASRTAKSAKVGFAHDMVFMLDIKMLEDRFKSRGGIFSCRPLAWRRSKRLCRSWLHAWKTGFNKKTLFAFREDIEKTSLKIPRNNIDVSQAFAADGMSCYQSLDATYAAIKFLGKFDSIETNRLHVGILATLLGKQVKFYDNSYGKNFNVYRASIQNNFNNLRVAHT